MAGVPSSKGCRQCLRQKKKCDQLKPSCSRCARLKIPCVGAGQQRYRFKTVTFKNSSYRDETPAQQPDESPPTTISPLLRNTSHLASRFILALELPDLRYSLGCYGDFFEHIPRRLGENDALDASVKALVSAFPYHYTGRIPPDALANYIHALKALRLSLGRDNKNLAPETLSAIYIIMICQGWIGRSDDHVKSHGEILARLTSSAIVQNSRDAFEIRLLETLFVPLALEAMVNPAISMDSWYMLIDSCLPLKSPDKHEGIRVPSLEAQKLVRMPVFFHNPVLHLADIERTYHEMCADQPKIRQYLVDLDREASGLTLNDPARANSAKLSHKFQVVYSVLLTIATALNSLLRTLNPDDTALLEEAAVLTDDFIVLAHHASRYRPLGASYIPPCLAAVWATTDALTEQQVELERLMTEYQPDFPQIKWMEQAVWLKSSHNALLGQLTSPAPSEASWDGLEMLNMSMVHCKAAFGPSGSYLFL